GARRVVVAIGRGAILAAGGRIARLVAGARIAVVAGEWCAGVADAGRDLAGLSTVAHVVVAAIGVGAAAVRDGGVLAAARRIAAVGRAHDAVVAGERCPVDA